MQRLIQALVKFRFLFLFLFLELISFFMIVRFNSYQSTLYFNSTNYVSAKLLDASTSVSSYVALRNENEILKSENAYLRKAISNYMKSGDHSATFLETRINLADTTAAYEFVPAKVINNSTFGLNNYLTINKGSEDGITKGMGVISSNGVVGKVKYVSSHYALAISLLNSKNTTSAEIHGKDILGSVVWEGKNYRYAKLNFVPKHLKISIGDTVVTSGYNAIFPTNIPVGIISNVRVKEGESFHDISVKLFTDFNTLRHVSFIKNKYRKEQMEIEELPSQE